MGQIGVDLSDHHGKSLRYNVVLSSPYASMNAELEEQF